jgi:hypothetical protein
MNKPFQAVHMEFLVPHCMAAEPLGGAQAAAETQRGPEARFAHTQTIHPNSVIYLYLITRG